MYIAIASGKGGTGKTTLAVNLAVHVARAGHPVVLADCDVEEPNAHLFLSAEPARTMPHTIPVPQIDASACLGETCRQCVTECRFNALTWMKGVMPFSELCHSCGLCMMICPAGAITETSRTVGMVEMRTPQLPQSPKDQSGNATSLTLVSGRMRISEAMAPPLIREVKQQAHAISASIRNSITFWDSPPGTSCPMISTVEDADYTVLVTEPTPFGLHDLNLAVETMRTLKRPFGVIINRDGMGDNRALEYLKQQNIPLLGTIPHSVRAAQAVSSGGLLIDAVEGMEQRFDELSRRILHHASQEIPSDRHELGGASGHTDNAGIGLQKLSGRYAKETSPDSTTQEKPA
ncbi:P-loop NTPase [Oleidesulfovibrio sp.]|uniref:nucleotide-binding protein n=1 Tax=Oleidesulfovibrio sp. TaxID=2909707 RepID=UPI003A895A88